MALSLEWRHSVRCYDLNWVNASSMKVYNLTIKEGISVCPSIFSTTIHWIDFIFCGCIAPKGSAVLSVKKFGRHITKKILRIIKLGNGKMGNSIAFLAFRPILCIVNHLTWCSTNQICALPEQRWLCQVRAWMSYSKKTSPKISWLDNFDTEDK